MRSLRKAGIKDKTVVIRADFNVPIKDGKVTSEKRIRSAMPTIEYCLKKGARRIVLMSHLGRPKGKPDKDFSLLPVAKVLKRLLKKKVDFIEDISNVEKGLLDSYVSKVALLENLRFFPEEKHNDAKFARRLASLGDIYVNDAFGTSHRKHASVHAITRYLPSYPGFLLESELSNLDLDNPKRPFVFIIGGAKVSDKIGVLKKMSKKADVTLVGGAMSFTFMRAMGIDTGKSLVEEDKLDQARSLMRSSKERLCLPLDVKISTSLKRPSNVKSVRVESIPKGAYGLDIGPETVEAFSHIISKSKTVLWNGPMGLFEMKPFDKGTKDIARSVAKSKGKTIIGGGDSVSAVEGAKLESQMTHISTGGGASLELIEGKRLPGLTALENNAKKRF